MQLLGSMRKTEEFADTYRDLETRESSDILRTILGAQERGLAALKPAIPAIAAAADAAADCLRKHPAGRLIYAGAGTSARLGVQDGVELVPTFGWPEERLAYLIAGGPAALTHTAEGAEDNVEQAMNDARALTLRAGDVCISLSASGVTPYAISACNAARTAGALTIGIANNPDTPLLYSADHAILMESGPEPIGGSTRMTAGTTQKVALNLFSTLTMIRMGRVYHGMMVDVIPSNAKLRKRAVRIVVVGADTDESTARAALETTDYHVKTAILVALGFNADAADDLIETHHGDLHAILAVRGIE
ncbi:MAG: N-acetylmuramic acid 6-phosphate etherase [Alphaproteobacteria bacterium]|nr:N-acetylmuramic acid 6-phosphate etherase [Alphaproteobacteria bacterium]